MHATSHLNPSLSSFIFLTPLHSLIQCLSSLSFLNALDIASYQALGLWEGEPVCEELFEGELHDGVRFTWRSGVDAEGVNVVGGVDADVVVITRVLQKLQKVWIQGANL